MAKPSASMHVMPAAINSLVLASPLPRRPRLAPVPLVRHSKPLKRCRCQAVRPPLPPDNSIAHPSILVRPCHARRARPLVSRVPAWDNHFFGHIVVHGIIGFASVFICLFLSLVSSLFSLASPCRLCHRTSTFAVPFDLAPAVAP